jgi:hypothetical protein
VKINQQKFLDDVDVHDECDALKNTIKASFGRNKIYNDQANPIKRRELGKALKAELQKISAQYDNAVGEEAHCKNIEGLANTITKQFGDNLNDERFKIGTAQKALNLHLKFRWCLGKQKMPPPHCPLDSRILKKAGIYKPWTKLNCIETYKSWIKKLKDRASPESLPAWELDNWKREAKS